jgi:hypothetical protein
MASDDFNENPENLAICSMICGLASLFMVFSGHFILMLVGLGLGLVAVSYGVRVLRGAAANKKLAVTGTVTGTIAVTLWVIHFIVGIGSFVWHRF